MSEENHYIAPDKIKHKMANKVAFDFILKYIKPFWKGYAISLFLLIMSSIAIFVSARYLGYLMDDGFVKRDWEYTVILGSVVLGIELLLIIIYWQGNRIIAIVATKSLLEIRKSVFEHLRRLPISYYDKQPKGRIVTRMTHDVENIESLLTSSMSVVLHSLLTLVVAIIAMLITDARLGVWILLSVIPLVFFTILTKSRLTHLHRETSITNSHSNAKLSELLDGISVIRTFKLEDWSKDRYDSTVGDHTKSRVKTEATVAWVNPLLQFLSVLPVLTLFYLGGKDIFTGALNIGIFVAFFQYCNNFAGPLATLMSYTHEIQSALTSMERISEFLKTDDENVALGADGALVPESLRGAIQFKDLSMSYNGKTDVLKNINFSIHPGEIIGLVGETGSGKSSTVHLLSRLYPFREGAIFIDGKPIQDYQRDRLRTLIGFVSQDVILFKGTLRENLTLGSNVDDETILSYCVLTGFYKIMERNALSLDTLIFDQGTNLSVGEKQLVSLTRILIKELSILILDEATANVDLYCEELVLQTIEQGINNRTCLIIGHRLNMLKICDRLLVFKNGEIVESGHYSDLMQQEGYFYQLQKKHSA